MKDLNTRPWSLFMALRLPICCKTRPFYSWYNIQWCVMSIHLYRGTLDIEYTIRLTEGFQKEFLKSSIVNNIDGVLEEHGSKRSRLQLKWKQRKNIECSDHDIFLYPSLAQQPLWSLNRSLNLPNWSFYHLAPLLKISHFEDTFLPSLEP